LPIPFRRKKSARAKIKKCEAIFLRGEPPLAAAGGGAKRLSFFSRF